MAWQVSVFIQKVVSMIPLSFYSPTLTLDPEPSPTFISHLSCALPGHINIALNDESEEKKNNTVVKSVACGAWEPEFASGSAT